MPVQGDLVNTRTGQRWLLHQRSLMCTFSVGIVAMAPPGPIQGLTAGASMEPRPRSYRTFLSGLHRLVIAGVRTLFWVGLITWSALAIHYSNLPWAGPRTVLAAAFAAFALWLSRRRHIAAGALFLGVVAWWIAIPPSHDRP